MANTTGTHANVDFLEGDWRFWRGPGVSSEEAREAGVHTALPGVIDPGYTVWKRWHWSVSIGLASINRTCKNQKNLLGGSYGYPSVFS